MFNVFHKSGGGQTHLILSCKWVVFASLCQNVTISMQVRELLSYPKYLSVFYPHLDWWDKILIILEFSHVIRYKPSILVLALLTKARLCSLVFLFSIITTYLSTLIILIYFFLWTWIFTYLTSLMAAIAAKDYSWVKSENLAYESVFVLGEEYLMILWK